MISELGSSDQHNAHIGWMARRGWPCEIPLCFETFAIDLKAELGAAPGVDFGRAGKRSGKFSYASSEKGSFFFLPGAPTVAGREGLGEIPDPSFPP